MADVGRRTIAAKRARLRLAERFRRESIARRFGERKDGASRSAEGVQQLASHQDLLGW